MKIYVPRDAAARGLGADEVATAVLAEAAKRGVAVELVRNGSRGMVWLEPLVEVATDAGRVAFGPMTVADVPGLFADLGSHPKALGPDRGPALDGARPG
jgi:formate dehydrogenase iron-sulfur subunit